MYTKPSFLTLLFICLLLSCNQNAEKKPLDNAMGDSSSADSTAAENRAKKEEMAETDEANYLEDTVFMRINRDTVKRSELDQPIMLTITNNQYEEIMTGERYTIEKLESQEWRKVPGDRFFNDLGYIFKKGSSIDFDIHLPIDGYRYEPGKYRIRKGYSVKIREYEYDEYELYSEIMINE
ncbi:immunoglobulin-like domain-containing protein [Tunicatimonas pelagia]|uniref:immunoglobulin-like domain-containing protein n=1 Tax=Tunicatimonas pelagia TaxID=931531 RepID=UPI0026664DAC|nr:immunoglobulin-like domain-containing protein [Tunicatimonas pelagia]WKN45165.1 hypothetical protein P0M28_09345 [Tunicatimonas pelagia]